MWILFENNYNVIDVIKKYHCIFWLLGYDNLEM